VSHDPAPPPERPDRIPLRGRRILLVEDEALIALMVQDALVEAGAEVTTAHSARAAIAAFAPGHFAAAVVNPGLPDLSGVDVIRQFRVAQPRLPVVVVTGSVAKFGETGSCLLDSGTPTAVLEKPFDLAVLVEVISDLLAAAERGPGR
jgi:DNA-binding response OmpR family regulator